MEAGYGAPGLEGMAGLVYVTAAAPAPIRTYRGLISGTPFVGLLIGVGGGVAVLICLIVITIALIQNRDQILPHLYHLTHPHYHKDDDDDSFHK